jgi:PilZ domain
MPKAATIETTAPCPKCKMDMTLAAVTPHAVASQLARHTYLCGTCNQTKTYILPVDPSATHDGEAADASDSGAMPTDDTPDDRRQAPREMLAASATIYDKDGNFLLPCTIRDLSKTGARLELSKDTLLPQYFLVSLLPDGSGRRLCSKVWQIALIAGVRFVERQRI